MYVSCQLYLPALNLISLWQTGTEEQENERKYNELQSCQDVRLYMYVLKAHSKIDSHSMFSSL